MGDDSNRRRVIAPNRRGYIIYEINGSMNSQYSRRGGFEKKVQKKKNDQDDRENEERLQEVLRRLEEKNEVIRGIEGRLKEYEENIKAMKAEAGLHESKVREYADELKDMERAAERNKGRRQAV